MTWPDVTLGIATALNVAATAGYCWLIQRWRVKLAAQDRLIEKLLPCAGFVAYLARPETGAPDFVREQCVRILPPGVRVEVHPMPAPNGQVH
jgi:hypothetical protein